RITARGDRRSDTRGKAGSHAANYGAPTSGEHPGSHRGKSHTRGAVDGRKPAHRAQQDSRVRSAGPEGLMSWMNTPQMMLLERYLDVVSMRQTLVSTNVANVDTPGYARQRPELIETSPVQIGAHLTFGTGVQLLKVTSLRDAVLDLRVNQETQQENKLTAFLAAGQQIQALFNE